MPEEGETMATLSLGFNADGCRNIIFKPLKSIQGLQPFFLKLSAVEGRRDCAKFFFTVYKISRNAIPGQVKKAKNLWLVQVLGQPNIRAHREERVAR